MKNIPLPAVWLLVVITGLPLISETIYTPALPDIGRSLAVSDSWVEYTLTIFLVGFAFGTLFWGKISDKFGRKPCLLLGIFIYILGCIGCYFSNSITLLMISRFVQAFGGSTGSVLGQAIARDSFRGVERGRVYSTLGGALAFSPAIGPFVGGLVDQVFGWPSIFLLLVIFGGLVFLLVGQKLSETHLNRNSAPSLLKTTGVLLKDSRVVGFGVLVGAANGIQFSYFAEGPFYLIDLLGLSPAQFGASFIGIAFLGAFGGFISKRLHRYLTSDLILWRGILVLLSGASFFLVASLLIEILDFSSLASIVITIGSMMVIYLGTAMISPNCLSLALEEYQHAVGTASSLFGFFYYGLISLFTFGIGFLHNDTLYLMPLYFFGISLLILIVFLKLIKRKI